MLILQKSLLRFPVKLLETCQGYKDRSQDLKKKKFKQYSVKKIKSDPSYDQCYESKEHGSLGTKLVQSIICRVSSPHRPGTKHDYGPLNIIEIIRKQVQLGVPHSGIQVELGFILQAGTCQILNFSQNPRQSQSVQGTELNWGGHHTEKVYTGRGDTAHIFWTGGH